MPIAAWLDRLLAAPEAVWPDPDWLTTSAARQLDPCCWQQPETMR